jgi:hypothetical protein
MKEETIKIRIKGTKLDRPTKLRILPKLDAEFGVDGIAEVPERFSDLLFSPGQAGRFELVEEKKVVPKSEEKKVVPKSGQQVSKEKIETQEFVKNI